MHDFHQQYQFRFLSTMCSVIIFFKAMYNKTIIRFGFCDILNNQGLGKCYQRRPSAGLITLTETLIILNIPKTDSNTCLTLQWYVPGGLLNKVLYEEAPPRVSTPYPYIYNIFDRKGTPFVYLLLKWYPFHTPILEICITDLRTPSSTAIREIPTFSFA